MMKGWGRIVVLGGLLMVLFGAFWAAQGSGLAPYPAESFMVNDFSWVYKGGAVAIVGLVIVGAGIRLMRTSQSSE